MVISKRKILEYIMTVVLSFHKILPILAVGLG